MALLQLDNISVNAGATALLRNIHLQLNSGEILGVIGPNGAGKTTLLNAISGITDSDGKVTLAGVELHHWNLQKRARSLAMLPQLSLLNFPYRVEEVVALGRTPHDSGASVDAAIIDEVLGAMDIEGLRERLYPQLSGGEKQRVQLARVFSQIWRTQDAQARLLLLDEPTAALDLAHQQLLLKAVRQLANSGCAVILVVHDFNLLAGLADQLLVLLEGQEAARGSPVEVLTTTLFREVFKVEVQIQTHPNSDAPLVISQ